MRFRRERYQHIKFVADFIINILPYLHISDHIPSVWPHLTLLPLWHSLHQTTLTFCDLAFNRSGKCGVCGDAETGRVHRKNRGGDQRKQPTLRSPKAEQGRPSGCCFVYGNGLAGLVVKVSALGAEDRGSNPACDRIFPGSSHTSCLKIGTPVATLPGAWRYRDSTGIGQPGVSILWLDEVESLICNFYLSVAAHKIVYADPSLRYISLLLEC